MCTVLRAALPYPHAVIPIEPDDGRSRGGAFVTERKRGLLAIRQAPGRFGTCPRARRVSLGIETNGSAAAPQPGCARSAARARDESPRRSPNEQPSAVLDCALPSSRRCWRLVRRRLRLPHSQHRRAVVDAAIAPGTRRTVVAYRTSRGVSAMSSCFRWK